MTSEGEVRWRAVRQLVRERDHRPVTLVPTYGDLAIVNSTFGQLVSTPTATNAIPALANIDPPRMFQFQVKFSF